MSWDAPNVYYNPEKFDLEQVTQIDYSDGCYQFDYRVIWRHKPTGQLYTARDSGCSCPSPFEEYTKLEDLETLCISEIRDEVIGCSKDKYYDGDNPTSFLEKLRALEGK